MTMTTEEKISDDRGMVYRETYRTKPDDSGYGGVDISVASFVGAGFGATVLFTMEGRGLRTSQHMTSKEARRVGELLVDAADEAEKVLRG